MPTRATVTLPRPGQPKTFYIYSHREFIKSWYGGVGIQPEDFSRKGLNEVILFHIGEINDAVVVAAKFVRELDYAITTTHYDDERGVLYLYYGGYHGPHSQEKSDRLKQETLNLLRYITKIQPISSIKFDKWGERLLQESFETMENERV